MEDRTLRVAILQRNPGSTAREIAQRIRGLSPAQSRVLLGGLVEDGRVTIQEDPTVNRYELNASSVDDGGR